MTFLLRMHNSTTLARVPFEKNVLTNLTEDMTRYQCFENFQVPCGHLFS